MEIDPTTLTPRDAYGLMIACVIPRPIAWTSTMDNKGNANLAPFSFFGGVTSDPMTVMISIGRRKGIRKDTARNLLDNGEAVIHIATRSLATEMVHCSTDAAVDEFELAGLTKLPSVEVRPPRIAEAAIAMEASVQQSLQVGNGPVDVFLLEIVHLHVHDEFVVDGKPDAAKLRAVGRLGGAHYCDTGDPFEVERP